MATILIVDDDPDIGNAIEELLRVEGHDAVRAYSGSEALLLLKQGPMPDLMLLDLMLPGATGEQVLAEAEDIPVIVISARGETQSKVGLLRAGAADYITKPFDPDELLARVEVQLRSTRSAGSRIYCCGISYDTQARAASVNGTPVRLTPTEDALLRVLMEHPRQILTKSALLDMLMPISEDGTAQSLKQHMSNLRRKLRDAGAADCIEAVRGIGFRMRDETVKKS